jgi:hypothetical protein
MPGTAMILAHNPGGSGGLPVFVLMALPVPFVVAAVVLIIRKRNLPALLAILAAVDAGFLSLKLLADSIV